MGQRETKNNERGMTMYNSDSIADVALLEDVCDVDNENEVDNNVDHLATFSATELFQFCKEKLEDAKDAEDRNDTTLARSCLSIASLALQMLCNEL